MDGRPYRGIADIITCGFPCQPFSLAGKGKGDKDDRFIWPENMRIIREVQPSYVVAENVPGLLNKHPLVFERVCTDLENEGYEVTPVIIPACAVEEDHIRERIFFIAYNLSLRRVQQGEGSDLSDREQHFPGQGERWNKQPTRPRGSIERSTSHYNSQRLASNICPRINQDEETNGTLAWSEYCGILPKAESWPEAATRLCGMDDGTAGRLDTETISKARWRKESIIGYGNAVHWKVAYEIFRAIEHTQNQ